MDGVVINPEPGTRNLEPGTRAVTSYRLYREPIVQLVNNVPQIMRCKNGQERLQWEAERAREETRKDDDLLRLQAKNDFCRAAAYLNNRAHLTQSGRWPMSLCA